MVKQVVFGSPEIKREAEVQPELTGKDQLTPEEQERIRARMAPPAESLAEGWHLSATEQLIEGSTREVPMTRRSWYISKAASDALAEAVDDIHHATRGIPKHVVASLLFELAARQAEGILAGLREREEGVLGSSRATGATHQG